MRKCIAVLGLLLPLLVACRECASSADSDRLKEMLESQQLGQGERDYRARWHNEKLRRDNEMWLAKKMGIKK